MLHGLIQTNQNHSGSHNMKHYTHTHNPMARFHLATVLDVKVSQAYSFCSCSGGSRTGEVFRTKRCRSPVLSFPPHSRPFCLGVFFPRPGCIAMYFEELHSVTAQCSRVGKNGEQQSAVCMYVCMYACVHVCVCIYIYIYLCICIRILICIYIYVYGPLPGSTQVVPCSSQPPCALLTYVRVRCSLRL